MTRKNLSASGYATLQRSERSFSIRSLVLVLESLGFVKALAAIYSTLLEETVSPRRTLHFIHAQLACIMLVLPIACPLLVHALLFVWAVLAVRGCRKS